MLTNICVDYIWTKCWKELNVIMLWCNAVMLSMNVNVIAKLSKFATVVEEANIIAISNDPNGQSS